VVVEETFIDYTGLMRHVVIFPDTQIKHPFTKLDTIPSVVLVTPTMFALDVGISVIERSQVALLVVGQLQFVIVFRVYTETDFDNALVLIRYKPVFTTW
jgi:hypothetical protein